MACVEDCSEAAWRYLGAIVLRPTRTSWYGRCDCRDCLEARRLHHDIAEHVRRRDAKWGQEARARNGGERHFDIPAVGEKGQQRTRPAMSGDRLKCHGADRRRTGVALARLHLLDTLERQAEVVAAAA